MSSVQIVRYPNRRFYARPEGRYVALPDIEQMIADGKNVEIRDSQSDEDLTRQVLTRIILERHPDKMRLFPTDMLHSILRSNEAMSDFLRDYFRHSLTYLDYLQQHGPASTLTKPIHWVKAWLDGMGMRRSGPEPAEPVEPPAADDVAKRIAALEARIRQLESAQNEPPSPSAG